jgi:hypothetical protein
MVTSTEKQSIPVAAIGVSLIMTSLLPSDRTSLHHILHSKHSLALEHSLQLREQLTHLGLLHVLLDWVEGLSEGDALDSLGGASRGLRGGGNPLIVFLDRGTGSALETRLARQARRARELREGRERKARGDVDHFGSTLLERLHSHGLSCMIAAGLSVTRAEKEGMSGTPTRRSRVCGRGSHSR